MQIDKGQILELLRSQGQHDQASQAEGELPDQVDTDQHAGLLEKLGLSPMELVTKFAGGGGGGSPPPRHPASHPPSPCPDGRGAALSLVVPAPREVAPPSAGLARHGFGCRADAFRKPRRPAAPAAPRRPTSVRCAVLRRGRPPVEPRPVSAQRVIEHNAGSTSAPGAGRRPGETMPLPTAPLRKLGFLTIGVFDGDDPGPGHESLLQVIELGEQLGFDSAWLRHRHLQYGVSSPIAIMAAAIDNFVLQNDARWNNISGLPPCYRCNLFDMSVGSNIWERNLGTFNLTDACAP